MTYQTKSPMQKNVGALWVKTAKKTGLKYMSGYVEINGAKIDIIVFTNKQKKEEKHPDYRIFPKENREYKAQEPERNQEALNDDDMMNVPF